MLWKKIKERPKNDGVMGHRKCPKRITTKDKLPLAKSKTTTSAAIIREVPPDVIFGLHELTLRLWKYGANSAVKCIRRLRLWACTHVEHGWVAPGPWVPRCCKFHPPDDVVFVFVFVLSVCPSRNRKSTCKNMAHPHVFVFVVCWSRNLSIVETRLGFERSRHW